jgi:hypothetical protein
VRRVRCGPSLLQRELELAELAMVVNRAWMMRMYLGHDSVIRKVVMVLLHVPGASMAPGAAPGTAAAACGCHVVAGHDGGRHRAALEGAGRRHCRGPVVAGTVGTMIPWLS